MTDYTPTGPQLVLLSPASTDTGRWLQDHALRLWNGTSGRPMRRVWPATDTLAAFLRHLYRVEGEPPPYIHRLAVSLPRETLPPGDPLACWVAYSGGKDALMAALMARDAGYTVTLYHVQGMNRWVASAELEAAQVGAQATGLPLVVDQVRLVGRSAGFVAWPTRNQTITTMMLARMLEAGARTYSLGNARSDTATGYIVTHGDLVESMTLWLAHLRTLVPDLHQRTWLAHQAESTALLVQYGLLEVPHGSCMSALRFRAHYRATNEARFGMTLLPGRCGSCGKCCWEYIVLDHLGYSVPPAFVTHCLKYMRRRQAEWGHPMPDLEDVRRHWAPPDVLAPYRVD